MTTAAVRTWHRVPPRRWLARVEDPVGNPVAPAQRGKSPAEARRPESADGVRLDLGEEAAPLGGREGERRSAWVLRVSYGRRPLDARHLDAGALSTAPVLLLRQAARDRFGPVMPVVIMQRFTRAV